MTNSEKRDVANLIIEELNSPHTRIIAKSEGKAELVHDIALYFFDGLDLLPGAREDIREMVKAAAFGCRYPTERIPAVTCKLSFEEVLLLSDVTKTGLHRAGETLFKLLQAMQDNDDERTAAIAGACRVVTEILKEGV